MFWFKKINIHIFLDGLSLFCKYARVAEYDLETDGKNYTITMHHELGEVVKLAWARYFSRDRN